MMAAIRAADIGAAVTLVERNKILGKKLLLSGKKRGNLTNDCDRETFLRHFGKNGQFLRDAIKHFFNEEVKAFFESRGLALKTERQSRVFPVTNTAQSIIDVLKAELTKQRVRVRYQKRVKTIVIDDSCMRKVCFCDNAEEVCDAVVLATGGLSYTFTGSSGDGLRVASECGHTIISPRPSLVPLEMLESLPHMKKALMLKNVQLSITYGKKKKRTEVGEVSLETQVISGALVLAESGDIVDRLAKGKGPRITIDCKPGLTHEQLHNRIVREREAHEKMPLLAMMQKLIPQSLAKTLLERIALSEKMLAGALIKKDRTKIVDILKAFEVTIKSPTSIEHAMVTRGGMSLKEINPRTMASRRIRGLYVAGEIIDCDADTGGFNMQAAFSTGHLAGESAAKGVA